MNTYIGIDLGTSSVKALLVDACGEILSEAAVSYPVSYPKSGWSEQDPELWYDSAVRAVRTLMTGREKESVKGISFGGQMHGLVLLDKADRVIRPAILWNDGRTEKENAYLNDVVGKDRLSDYTANISFAGFTAPKVLWVKENEPENFARIAKIMLPKDYLAYRFTGVHSTDYSDASGMLLLDVKSKKWSREMCEICGVNNEWLPKLFDSFSVTGTLLGGAASELGLCTDVSVTAGAGDNAAAAIGTGTVGDGECNVSLGTSGTIFISSDGFRASENNALHSFCHADGNYHLMGCILSAASCNKWWMEDILNTENFADEQKDLERLTGSNSVFFLPYLMGERSPHNDVNARGAFIGMRADTTRGEMTLAVLEGVAFAVRDCLEAAKQNGINLTGTKICGGGAKSKLWKQIIANVLDLEVATLKTEQDPAYGAAILAMTGCGEFASVRDAAETLVKTEEVILPDKSMAASYDKKYKIYKRLYPALKDCFKDF